MKKIIIIALLAMAAASCGHHGWGHHGSTDTADSKTLVS